MGQNGRIIKPLKWNQSLKKLNPELPYNPAIPHGSIWPRKTENRGLNGYLNSSAHSSSVHNSEKVKTTPTSISGWKEKEFVVYAYNGILFHHEKEWRTDIWYNLDEPQKGSHKRPCIIWFYLREMSRIGESTETVNGLLVARGWEYGGGGCKCVCLWGCPWGWWNVLELDRCDGCTTLWM